MARWMLWYQEQVQRNLRQENNSGGERAQSSASFTHLHNQPAFMLIQDFFCFNRSPIAIKQRNPHAQQSQATEMLDVVPQKSLRSKTNFYLKVNTGRTEIFALTLLSFTLLQWNEEKR